MGTRPIHARGYVGEGERRWPCRGPPRLWIGLPASIPRCGSTGICRLYLTGRPAVGPSPGSCLDGRVALWTRGHGVILLLPIGPVGRRSVERRYGAAGIERAPRGLVARPFEVVLRWRAWGFAPLVSSPWPACARQRRYLPRGDQGENPATIRMRTLMGRTEGRA
jgi:hypothetical protein